MVARWWLAIGGHDSFALFTEDGMVHVSLPHPVDNPWAITPFCAEQTPRWIVSRESHASHVDQRREAIGAKGGLGCIVA
jgi:hypothetical protein